MSETHVAYLGPEGTYTHQALRAAFADSAKLMACRHFAEIINAVESDAATYGIVPFENSTEGPVNPVLDALTHSQLTLQREVTLPIHHCLLVATAVTEINTIIAHPQALAQCRQWLAKHYPRAEHLAATSNAQAAKQAHDIAHAAAIAGELCAELYRLHIVSKHIEDDSSNTTRFFVIGKQTTVPSGNDKTSLILTLENKTGSLSQVLNLLAEHRVNMTMIHSRPVKNTPWHYRFFIDVEGHREDAPIQAAINALTNEIIDLRVLGSYPASTNEKG